MVLWLGHHIAWGLVVTGAFSVTPAEQEAERLGWNRYQTVTPYPCLHSLDTARRASCLKGPTITPGSTVKRIILQGTLHIDILTLN